MDERWAIAPEEGGGAVLVALHPDGQPAGPVLHEPDLAAAVGSRPQVTRWVWRGAGRGPARGGGGGGRVPRSTGGCGRGVPASSVATTSRTVGACCSVTPVASASHARRRPRGPG